LTQKYGHHLLELVVVPVVEERVRGAVRRRPGRRPDGHPLADQVAGAVEVAELRVGVLRGRHRRGRVLLVREASLPEDWTGLTMKIRPTPVEEPLPGFVAWLGVVPPSTRPVTARDVAAQARAVRDRRMEFLQGESDRDKVLRDRSVGRPDDEP
jgi:hypothetical protein